MNEDDFWGEFVQDYSGGIDKLFDFGINPSTLGGIDLGGISLDVPYIDLGDTGTLLSDLGGGGFDWDQFYKGIDSGIDLGGATFGDMSQWYSPQVEGFAGALDVPGYVYGAEGSAAAADEVGGAGYFPGYLVNPDGSITPYGFDKGYYGEGESHGVDERGMEYWVAPDGSVMYDKYVDEKGYERNPDGSLTGRTIEDIVGKENVTVPVGQTPVGPNTYKVTYDDGSTQTIRRNPNGSEEVVETTDTEGKVTPGPGGPGPSGPKKPGEGGGQTTPGGRGGGGGGGGGKDNLALLMALLGGLLGLLSKGSAPKGPVGYQGGIPKYTATRVPGRGVEYTKAATGGLMGLAAGGNARPARYLRGGTDGMADKIQTDIDGKNPARLSSGEFVIPADIVGALGSGNSEAGAEVLYDMMDRVRKHAYGHTKQIKQANPKKVLPA